MIFLNYIKMLSVKFVNVILFMTNSAGSRPSLMIYSAFACKLK